MIWVNSTSARMAWRSASPVLGAAFGTALVAGVLLAKQAAAQAPTVLYPDLRALPPSTPVLDRVTVDGTPRQVLRFTAAIWNAGQGPLELRGETVGDKTLAFQRIYDDAGGVSERLAGEFAYHEGHHHWHFENFAEYELWPQAEYEQWLASGRQQGLPRWRGNKTTGQGESFCIRDSDLVEPLPASPQDKAYDACDQELQGISVGWADTYPFFLGEQWIEIGSARLPNGRYVLRVIADPQNLLYESGNGEDPDREGSQANEAILAFRVRGATTEFLPEKRAPAHHVHHLVSH